MGLELDDAWYRDDEAKQFVKELKVRRRNQVDALVGAAKNSPDPAMQRNWAAIAALDDVISIFEEERGKPSK